MKKQIIIFLLILFSVQYSWAIGETSYIEGFPVEQTTPFLAILGISPEISDTSIDNRQYYSITKTAIINHPNHNDMIFQDTVIMQIEFSNFRINQDTFYVWTNFTNKRGEYLISDTIMFVQIVGGFIPNQHNIIQVYKFNSFPSLDREFEDNTLKRVLPFYQAAPLPQQNLISGFSPEQFAKSFIENVDGFSPEYFISNATTFIFNLSEIKSDYLRYKKLTELYPELNDYYYGSYEYWKNLALLESDNYYREPYLPYFKFKRLDNKYK